MKNPTALGYTKAANIMRGTHVAIRTVNAPYPFLSSPSMPLKRHRTATIAVTATALAIWKARILLEPNKANTSRYHSIGPLWNG